MPRLALLVIPGLCAFAVACGGHLGTTASPATSPSAAASVAASAAASPPATSTEQAANLKVGECLGSDLNGRVSTVNIVSCTTPHAAEVVAVLTMPDGPYPAQSVIDDYKNKCEDALNTYDPQSGPDNSIELTTLTPLQFDWSTGDHTMDCVASLSPPRTGSIKS